MATIPKAHRHLLSIHVATHGGAQPGQTMRALASALVALVLAGLLLLTAGCQPRRDTAAPKPLAPTPPAGRLQEVAPPAAVQQLQSALADRDPQVSIDAPADGSTVPAGSWTLRLKVRDWPLVDAGPLGLGAHIAVQVDDQPVLRLTEHRTASAGDVVEATLPPLPPGSHRITAYAARPWGEAVKNPGASARIRVQSVAGNPLALPAPGTPELVVVSPAAWNSAEPVLLDWLLFDAPLQHLREGDDSWRLRVSVNGDAFLMDQNVPLWLQGWKSGSNALQFELVDGRGEPLNPPFNSLVREVKLGGGSKQRWLAGPLKPNELAVLMGDIPPPPREPEPAPAPEPVAAAPAPAMEAVQEPASMAMAEPEIWTGPKAVAAPGADPAPAAKPEAQPEPPGGQTESAAPAAPSAAERPETEAKAELPATDEAVEHDGPSAVPAPTAENPAPPAPKPIANPERLAPSSSLAGSARELVAADGTLIQQTPRGPLAGLRQRLGGS